MTAKKFYLNTNSIDGIENYMIAYAKIKCQELLEIVAEKTKITSENTGEINERLIIDKDSILNCVDLENFCS